MALKSIEIHQFRNYENLKLDLSKGSTLLFGDNGQGKTNLIEAIFLLLQGYSFRSHKLSEMIPWGSKVWVLRGETYAGDEIALQYKSNGEKQLKLNGEKSAQFSKLLGLNPSVMIGPQDIELSQGGPSLRRRFLDSQLCQFDFKYLDELRLYQKSLKQRNAYLKMLKQTQSKIDSNLLQSYTEQLSIHGSQIVSIRTEWLRELSPLVEEFYHMMTKGKESLKLTESKWSSLLLSSDSIQNRLFDQIQEKLNYDLMTGVTSVGPHKDDFNVNLKEKSLRDFGSQGQQRSFSLSLKLGTAHWMVQKKGLNPTLLLDDVFAELDSNRRQSLVEQIMAFEQVFFTSPGEEKGLLNTDHVLQISGGKVTF